MLDILIGGGGPAGACAAIAARQEGASVRLVDRAASLRHKVCGEFLSPGVAGILQDLGVWHEFIALGPSTIGRCVLHLGNHTKSWSLSERAWGVSRLALDGMLLGCARQAGVTLERGHAVGINPVDSRPFIAAYGRGSRASAGDRLFGFKSHFEGPVGDAVELFFDKNSYAGVSGIEDDRTNVCGIAPESLLSRFGFDFDALIARPGALAARISPLRRTMRWIVTGPLSFSSPAASARENVYPAGDALGFVDPFTGTGIMNALLTGRLAGMAAARGMPAAQHVRECRALLGRPFLISSLLRRLVGFQPMHWLAPWLPGNAIFQLTRCGL